VAATKLHHGTVSGGKFLPDDPETFKRAFYGYEGKKCTVTVKRFQKNRSSNQNRYYHGVVVKMLAEHCGYTPEEMHGTLKSEFLREKGKNGMTTLVRSTADLSTVEFENYLEQIRQWASIEMNLFIPDPNSCEY